jgi:hypothetical protein
MKAFKLLVFVGFFLNVFADAYAADNNLVVQWNQADLVGSQAWEKAQSYFNADRDSSSGEGSHEREHHEETH